MPSTYNAFHISSFDRSLFEGILYKEDIAEGLQKNASVSKVVHNSSFDRGVYGAILYK